MREISYPTIISRICAGAAVCLFWAVVLGRAAHAAFVPALGTKVALAAAVGLLALSKMSNVTVSVRDPENDTEISLINKLRWFKRIGIISTLIAVTWVVIVRSPENAWEAIASLVVFIVGLLLQLYSTVLYLPFLRRKIDR